MSADGIWKLTLNGPTGAQEMTLDVTTAGSSFTGTVNASAGVLEVLDGTVDGNNLTWKANLTQPMALTLEFSGNIDGDAITGDAKLGSFGSATFTGTRQS